MLGLPAWHCSLFLLLVLISASVQAMSLPEQRLQVLLSQLLPSDPEEDMKEGSSSEPQPLSPPQPLLPSGARAAHPLLWRKALASRKRALSGDWAWKAVPRGCFGLKMDRIGAFSGLGC
ncbi:C-type natriuretic peptide 2-like [Cyrtonyx montezumae]|uniref:C-type natriuretic peptide 2-like n=1 Tax=Cyrtonyx montezumae TaxID=9017 RepID=UPI0032DA573F